MEDSNRSENNNDVKKLSNNDYASIEVAYNYGLAGLSRVQAKFTTLDTKASHTMGIIAVVVAILVLSFPASTERPEEIRALLFSSIIFFLLSSLFCLICLRVRKLWEAPTIGKLIDWLSKEAKTRTKEELLSELVIGLANAEISHYTVYEEKVRLLRYAQALQVGGIIILIISIGLSWYGLSNSGE